MMTAYARSRLTLLSLFAGVALCVACAGVLVYQAYRQKQAAHIFRDQFNSVVLYDFEKDPSGTKVPPWVRSLFGDDLFNSVVSVGVGDHGTSDDDIVCLESLPGLVLLNLSETKITDNGLCHVARCHNLAVLSIADTIVGDEGLKHLAHMKSLGALDLPNTRITDAGLVYLRDLSNLIALDINMTGVTGVGLRHLGPLPRLRSLGLAGDHLVPGALATLAALPSLEELDLSGTNVDDLQIVHLEKARRLRYLCLYKTAVSKEMIASLRQKVPDLTVQVIGRM